MMNKPTSNKAIRIAACAAFLITAAASGSALAAPGGNGNGKGLGNGGGGVDSGPNTSGVSIDVELKTVEGKKELVLEIVMENYSDDSPDVDDAHVSEITVQFRQQSLPDGPWVDLGLEISDTNAPEDGWTVPYVAPGELNYPGDETALYSIEYCGLLGGLGDFRLNADVTVTLSNGKKTTHKGRCDDWDRDSDGDRFIDYGVVSDESLITVTTDGTACGPK